MRKIILILGLLFVQKAICHQDTSYYQCNKKFYEITRNAKSFSEERSLWSQCGKYCSNDGAYEEHHAKIFVKYKKYDDCLTYLSNELKKYKKHNAPKRILFALGEVHYLLGDIKRSREIADDLTKRYYDWHGGYSLLGLSYLEDGDLKRSHYYFSLALKKEEGVNICDFSNLIKTNFFMENYKEVVSLFKSAEKTGLRMSEFAQEASICASIAMIETNKIEDGYKLLLECIKNNPDIVQHDGYKEAIRTYEQATGKPFNSTDTDK